MARGKKKFFGIGKASERIDTGVAAGDAPGGAGIPGWSGPPTPLLQGYLAGEWKLNYTNNLEPSTINQPEGAVMAQVPMELRNRLPKTVAEMLNMLADYQAKDAVQAMMERQKESKDFTSDSAAFLAGIAAVPEARAVMETEIDYHVSAQPSCFEANPDGSYKQYDEVVIGGGLHAAIYCAVRRELGHPRPLVLEAGARIGGAFAMTKNPAFYLNSRNRPGSLGMPGDDMASLNVIPGSPVQPCDLSAAEYQRNNDLALAVRLTLLMHSDPRANMKVTRVRNYTSEYFSVQTAGGNQILARKVIDARGMKSRERESSDRIMDYWQFMARMDQPFPLRGMRRVAVVGAGDSGKTVVEALLGQGPHQGWSTAALDWIDRIDWYGCGQVTAGAWRTCNRSRYQGLARFFPIRGVDEDGDEYGPTVKTGKINPIVRKAETWQPGYKCAYVDDSPYDAVIVCTGMSRAPSWFAAEYASNMDVGTRTIGRRLYSDRDLIAVGPAANIPLSVYERGTIGGIPENEVALFRLADRTATVAATV